MHNCRQQLGLLAFAVPVVSPLSATRRSTLLHFVVVVVLFALLASICQRAGALEIPANARANQSDDGWACEPSFRKIEGKCVVVTDPEHSYKTDSRYGQGWICSHGYVQVGENRCDEVIVPANGYLDSSGRSWKCDRGFRTESQSCSKVDVPANAFLTKSTHGRGWECMRGYRVAGGSCDPILVPSNGYLSEFSSRGKGWKCERGYRAQELSCVELIAPANGFLDGSTSGNGWTCNRGYRAQRSSCVAVDMPANSHLDYSGNNWRCSAPYRKSRSECVLR